MNIENIPVGLIHEGDRLRPVDPVRVAELATSMADQGQMSPIEVAPADDRGMHLLIAGAHRLAAVKMAGIREVKAIIFVGDADQRRLREIDENLYRVELTPFDEAAFLAERREIYERINGAIVRGRRKSTKLGELNQLSFWDDVTQKFGLSRRLVERSLGRKRNISPKAWLAMRGSSLGAKGVHLDALTRVPLERQIAVVTHALDHKTGLLAAIKAVMARPDTNDETLLSAIVRRWDKITPGERQRIVAFLVRKGAANPPATAV